jgi:hypothetical protein
MTARLNFLELPVLDAARSSAFYGAAFDWHFTAFGPTYACTMSGDTDLGFQSESREKSAAPLPVIQVDDLEAALAKVSDAGGTISAPIFAFPGGRRFHFLDPDGHELAAMQAA